MTIQTVKVTYEAYSVIDGKWKWQTTIVKQTEADALLAKMRALPNTFMNVHAAPAEAESNQG